MANAGTRDQNGMKPRESRRLKAPSRWTRSKSAIRVIWVGARWVRVWVRVRRIGRTRNSTADDGARRDTGGNTAPTRAAVIAATADVDVAVDIDVPAAIEISAVEVSAVDTSPGGAGPGTTASGAATVNPASGTSTAVETSAVGAPSGETTATSAITTSTATPAAATASPAATTASAAAASQKQQWRILAVRRRGGNIAGHAAAPDSGGGGRFGGHQSGQSDRRNDEEILGDHPGLTRWLGAKLRSGLGLLRPDVVAYYCIAVPTTDNKIRAFVIDSHHLK